MSDPKVEPDYTCRYGTHAPRDCPARVFALSGTTPPACPVPACECGHPSDDHDRVGLCSTCFKSGDRETTCVVQPPGAST